MFIKADVEISFLMFVGLFSLRFGIAKWFPCAVVDRDCSLDFADFDRLGNSLVWVVFSRGLP